MHDERDVEAVPQPLEPVAPVGPVVATAATAATCAPGTMRFPLETCVPFTNNFGDPRGKGRKHEGIDIMSPKLAPVRAAAAGTVTWMHDKRGGHCCDVEIQHDDGWRSRYIHLNNDTPGTDDGLGYGFAEGIVPGARVEAGQLIGWVGDSGNAEAAGSHLHFELRRPDGTPVNPHDLLVVWAATLAASQLAVK